AERAPGPRDVVSTPPASIHRAVADRLLADGRITKEQHDAATAIQKRGSRIEDALIEIEALSEPELLKYLASLHNTRFVSTEQLAVRNRRWGFPRVVGRADPCRADPGFLARHPGFFTRRPRPKSGAPRGQAPEPSVGCHDRGPVGNVGRIHRDSQRSGHAHRE